ncbi:MAG: cobalt ECF transporter T component CbiQ, partial [Spirochaetota bacterium]
VSFGTHVLFHAGKVPVYAEGLKQGGCMALRVYCDISWLAVVFVTTPFSDVLKALRWYRFPAILADTLSMMYRYSFMLYDEFRRMYAAAVSRGGAGSRILKIKSISYICAQIFIRAYDRSERIYTAMIARGGEQYMEKDDAVSSDLYSGEAVCRLSSVSFSYTQGAKALDDVSFVLSRGQAAAVCGQNGSGKTTLLKLCAGLVLPDAGTAAIMNKIIDKRTRRMLFKNAGFLFQDSDDQLFCPTVAEDIAFGPVNMKLSADEISSRVASAMAMMKITALAHRPIHDLSGGEKKRVALAGLLAMRTPFLIMDEPTAGLDPSSADGLIGILNELKSGGYTMLISTHDMERVPEFADRLILLDKGGIYRDGPMRDVMTDLDALAHCALRAPVITRYFSGISAGGSLPLNLEEALTRRSK